MCLSTCRSGVTHVLQWCVLRRGAGAGCGTNGAGIPQGDASCSAIESDIERLKCYDKEAKRQGEPVPPPAQPSMDRPSLMGKRWELDPGTEHGLFSIRPHKQVYVLPARYITDVNNQPSSPTEGTVPQSLGYINTEVKFQISFKMKVLAVKEHFDLWMGYTQLSLFQMYSKSISSPFRETNYEPEIMGVIHTNYDLFGLKWRFITLAWSTNPMGGKIRYRGAGIASMRNSDLSVAASV